MSWDCAVGYDLKAPKRPVNMTLNTDLVRRARGLTANLSETVEGLLAAFVAAEDAARDDLARQMARWAEASAEVVGRHGSPADEYDPF